MQKEHGERFEIVVKKDRFKDAVGRKFVEEEKLDEWVHEKKVESKFIKKGRLKKIQK